MKSKVIVDPSFRRMDEIFSPEDRQRLFDLVDVVWGRDEPMPMGIFSRHYPRLILSSALTGATEMSWIKRGSSRRSSLFPARSRCNWIMKSAIKSAFVY